MLSWICHHLLRRPYRLHAQVLQQPNAPVATVVLLHGLGCTKEVWQPLHGSLPANVQVIALDLLGFGDSPKPADRAYSNATQARAIISTLRRLQATDNVVLVGHSLGALAALAVAARRPRFITQVTACGAPIYHTEHKRDEALLKKLYDITAQNFQDNQSAVVAAATFLQKTGLAPRSMELNHQTIRPYIASLRQSIIRQKTYTEVRRLSVPVLLLCGRFDPLVSLSTSRQLAVDNPRVTLKHLLASHELSGGYLRRVRRQIRHLTATSEQHS